MVEELAARGCNQRLARQQKVDPQGTPLVAIGIVESALIIWPHTLVEQCQQCPMLIAVQSFEDLLPYLSKGALTI